jgi:hypothetical protein
VVKVEHGDIDQFREPKLRSLSGTFQTEQLKEGRSEVHHERRATNFQNFFPDPLIFVALLERVVALSTPSELTNAWFLHWNPFLELDLDQLELLGLSLTIFWRLCSRLGVCPTMLVPGHVCFFYTCRSKRESILITQPVLWHFTRTLQEQELSSELTLLRYKLCFE